MQIKISHVIEKKLAFLKLTRAGKIRLTVFSDKVLYKGLSLLQRNFTSMPEHPFNMYFALCLHEGQRLQLEPDWSTMASFPTFDEKGPVTIEEEYFDAKICHEELVEWKKERTTSWAQKQNNQSHGNNNYNNSNTNKSHGSSFNRCIKYYAYGEWYQYPDNTWTRESRPILPTSQKQADWLISQGIDPKDELRKALSELAEEQISIFHLYEDPLMKEFVREQRGDIPKTRTPRTGPEQYNPRGDQNDPRRLQLNPVEELKKAIKSGNINKKGLAFLRDVYLTHKPELIPLIDEFLKGEVQPDDTQRSLFKIEYSDQL